ncbi:antitoxin Xre/MbcA/ParS toxin-binding domain-containing protein [Egicoccus sp. AB-alg6-2]|uniref:antitoxin Xre/MbcA/ParS toxin-binding domain-containing protein n=1 Tax=Egicoccus sp. AB-alg6-2 TaxID=3242692 RepID=UPI00359DAE55
MYRDDPLDDELELRAIIGDDAVDTLHEADLDHERHPVEVALDVLRVLQGWVDESATARWFTQPQKRLDGRTPIEALRGGAFEEVEDAGRAWAAAHG